MIEFILTGIPLISVWISVVQMSIGMWYYHTLQYSVKTAGEYIAHHGATCSSTGYSCSIQIKDAASVLATAATGLDRTKINVTFYPVKSDHTTVGTTVVCRLDNCMTDTTPWPPAGYSAAGADIEIKADFLFQSALSMVAPGPGVQSISFGSFHLPAYTHQFYLF
jgi:hypothetical protein